MHDFYQWLKAFHILAVIAWMAGMLYLPRLFVYHTQVAPRSEASELFKVMEKRLLRYIMNPAMIITLLLGLWMAIKVYDFDPQNGYWLHAKVTLVLCMCALHGFFSVCRKRFASDKNTYTARFYRILNEVPAVLLVGIILLVVLKPF